MAKNYWLFKSEPDVFSIHDLERAKKQTTHWEGVRNYQARNLLRDDIKVGDGVLFYHSRVKPMAVAGTATVVRAGYPDPDQFDMKSKYHDASSKPEDPRWYCVDIQLESIFSTPVTLDEMREIPSLGNMVLLRKGSRLSIQPVRKEEWSIITKLGRRK